MASRLLGSLFALLMMIAGSLWTLQGLGWIGQGPASEYKTQASLGPILAGLGVALGFVSLRPRR